MLLPALNYRGMAAVVRHKPLQISPPITSAKVCIYYRIDSVKIGRYISTKAPDLAFALSFFFFCIRTGEVEEKKHKINPVLTYLLCDPG